MGFYEKIKSTLKDPRNFGRGREILVDSKALEELLDVYEYLDSRYLMEEGEDAPAWQRAMDNLKVIYYEDRDLKLLFQAFANINELVREDHERKLGNTYRSKTRSSNI